MLEKKSYTVVCQEKNSFTIGLGRHFLYQPNNTYPHLPLKSQMVGLLEPKGRY